jgi:hypothetical protein
LGAGLAVEVDREAFAAEQVRRKRNSTRGALIGSLNF